MRANSYWIVIVVVLVTGCSASIKHSTIRNDLAPGTPVDGIPYHTLRQYKATIFTKTDKGYVEVASKELTLPDEERLNLINFNSKAFSNSTLDLKLYGNNTLQSVSLTATNTGPAALTAAATQITALATSEKGLQTAGTTASTTAAAAVTAASAALVAAAKGKDAADLAQLQYDNLLKDPTATSEQVLTAAIKVREAKLDANEAARVAGKASPFPDVVP
jgi:hypothetical protein